MLGGGGGSLGDEGEKSLGGGGGRRDREGKKESSLWVCKCDRGKGGLWPANGDDDSSNEIFFLNLCFGDFFCLHTVQFLDHGFASNVGSNGYNTRVAMDFHRFG